MLGDEEKAGIREEEEFRHQVRRELQGPTKGPSGWDIVNSPLIVALVVSGLLSYVTWKYSADRALDEKREALGVRAMKLHSEIATRVEELRIAEALFTNNAIRDAIDSATLGKGSDWLHPDLRGRPTRELLWELEDYHTSEKRRKKLELAMKAVGRLRMFRSSVEGLGSPPKALKVLFVETADDVIKNYDAVPEVVRTNHDEEQ